MTLLVLATYLLSGLRLYMFTCTISLASSRSFRDACMMFKCLWPRLVLIGSCFRAQAADSSSQFSDWLLVHFLVENGRSFMNNLSCKHREPLTVIIASLLLAIGAQLHVGAVSWTRECALANFELM